MTETPSEGEPRRRPGWPDDVEEMIYRLRRLTYAVRVRALVAFVVSLLIVVAAVVVITWAQNSYLTGGGRTAIIASFAGFVIMSILLLAIYDAVRKQGNSIYDELSFTLEQSLRRVRNRPDDINLRVALREWTRASQIPLLPANAGPAVLLLINVAALLTAAFGVSLNAN